MALKREKYMIKYSVLLASNKLDPFFFDAIESILKQDYDNFEFIIVLNGISAKDSDIFAKKISDHRIRLLISNFRYLNCALNLGIQKASGEYIVRMDADDLSIPSRLSTINKTINDLTNTPIVIYSDYDFIDKNNIITTNQKKVGKLKNIFYRNVINHPTAIIKREALLNLGGYLGSIFSEDYDLWVRVLRDYGYDAFLAVPDKLIFYRIDPTGEARGSKYAYIGVSAVQFREFIMTFNLKWLIGCIESLFKAFIYGK